MQYIIIILLSVAALLILAKYIALNRQIKSIRDQMRDFHNNYVAVDFINRNLEELTVSINKVMDDKENARIETTKNYKILQQSIANISHDMRTPLTSVIGYLQLAMKACTDEQQKQNMSIALERAKYCNQLINEFYELSIAEAKDSSIKLEKIDLSSLLCDQILGNYVDFETHKLKPIFLQSDRPMWIMADKVLLIRILQNLFSNALKYAVKDIDFHIEQTENNITKLTVSNPVIQDDIDTELIFEKYYQKNLSRGSSGSGIGLYLCRSFAEKIGGSISAECKNGRLIITLCFVSAPKI